MIAPDDLVLKTLTRVLIERVGGLDAAASCTRVGRSVLSGYQSPHVAQFIPEDVSTRLECVAVAPILTEERARRVGYQLVRADGAVRGNVPQLLAKLGGECAELHAAFAEAISDGHLCATDRAAITREASHVLRKVSDLLAALNEANALDARPGSIVLRGPT